MSDRTEIGINITATENASPQFQKVSQAANKSADEIRSAQIKAAQDMKRQAEIASQAASAAHLRAAAASRAASRDVVNAQKAAYAAMDKEEKKRTATARKEATLRSAQARQEARELSAQARLIAGELASARRLEASLIREQNAALKEEANARRAVDDAIEAHQAKLIALGTAVGTVTGLLAVAGNEYYEHQRTIKSLEAVYGGAADSVIAFSKEVQASSNFADEQARSGLLVASTLQKNYDLSTEQIQELISVSADLAQVYNIDLHDAVMRTSAAIRGEAESAEILGLTLSDTFLASEAAARGMDGWTTTMTESEKALFRYQVLMEQTAYAQGEAAKSSETLRGQMIGLGHSVQDTLVALGGYSGPVGELLAGFSDLAIALPIVGAGFGTVRGQVAGGLRVIGQGRVGFTELGETLAGLVTKINPVGVALTGVGVASAFLIKSWLDQQQANADLEASFVSLTSVITTTFDALNQQRAIDIKFDLNPQEAERRFSEENFDGLNLDPRKAQEMLDLLNATVLTTEEQAKANQLLAQSFQNASKVGVGTMIDAMFRLEYDTENFLTTGDRTIETLTDLNDALKYEGDGADIVTAAVAKLVQQYASGQINAETFANSLDYIADNYGRFVLEVRKATDVQEDFFETLNQQLEARTILDGTTARWTAMAEEIERTNIIADSFAQNFQPAELGSLYLDAGEKAVQAAGLAAASEAHKQKQLEETNKKIEEQAEAYARLQQLISQSAGSQYSYGTEALPGLYLTEQEKLIQAIQLEEASRERANQKRKEAKEAADEEAAAVARLNQAIREGNDEPPMELGSLYRTEAEKLRDANELVEASTANKAKKDKEAALAAEEHAKQVHELELAISAATAAGYEYGTAGLGGLYRSDQQKLVDGLALEEASRQRVLEKQEAQEEAQKRLNAAIAEGQGYGTEGLTSLYRSPADVAQDQHEFDEGQAEREADALEEMEKAQKKAEDAARELADAYRDDLNPAIEGVSDELRDLVGPGANAIDILEALGGSAGAVEHAAQGLLDSADAIDSWAASFEGIADAGRSGLALVDELIGSQSDREEAALDAAEAERDYIEETHEIEKSYRQEMNSLNRQYTQDVKDNAREKAQAEKDYVQEVKDLERQRAEVARDTEQQLADLASQRREISLNANRALADAEREYHQTLNDNIGAQRELRKNLQEQTREAGEAWRDLLRDQKEELREIQDDLRKAQRDLSREFLRDEQDIGIALKRLNEDLAIDLSDPDLTPERRAAIELAYRRDVEDLMLKQARTQEDYYREEKENREEARKEEQKLAEERKEAQEEHHERLKELRKAASDEAKQMQRDEAALAKEYAKTRQDILKGAAADQRELDGQYHQILQDQEKAFTDIEKAKRLAARDSAIEQRTLARETSQIERGFRKDVGIAERQMLNDLKEAQDGYKKSIANTAGEASLLDKALAEGLITQEEYNTAVETGTHIQDLAGKQEVIRAALIAKNLPGVVEEYEKLNDAQMKILEMPESDQKRALWWTEETNRIKLATAASLVYDGQLDKLPDEVVTDIVANIEDDQLRELVEKMLPDIRRGAKAPITIATGENFNADATAIGADIDKVAEPRRALISVQKGASYNSNYQTVQSSLKALVAKPYVAIIHGNITGLTRAISEAERKLVVFTGKGWRAKIDGDRTALDRVIRELQEELDGKVVATTYVNIKGRDQTTTDEDDTRPSKTSGGGSSGTGTQRYSGGQGSGYFWAGEHEPELIYAPQGAYVYSGSASVSKVQAMGFAGGGRSQPRGATSTGGNNDYYKEWLKTQPIEIRILLRDMDLTAKDKKGLVSGQVVVSKNGKLRTEEGDKYVPGQTNKDKNSTKPPKNQDPDETPDDLEDDEDLEEDDEYNDRVKRERDRNKRENDKVVRKRQNRRNRNRREDDEDKKDRNRKGKKDKKPYKTPEEVIADKPEAYDPIVTLDPYDTGTPAFNTGQFGDDELAGSLNTPQPVQVDNSAAMYAMERQISRLTNTLTTLARNQSQPLINNGTIYNQSKSVAKSSDMARRAATSLRV